MGITSILNASKVGHSLFIHRIKRRSIPLITSHECQSLKLNSGTTSTYGFSVVNLRTHIHLRSLSILLEDFEPFERSDWKSFGVIVCGINVCPPSIRRQSFGTKPYGLIVTAQLYDCIQYVFLWIKSSIHLVIEKILQKCILVSLSLLINS